MARFQATTSKLLQKKMSRKEFLIFLGVIFLTVSGLNSILNNLNKVIDNKPNPKQGFGSGPYGA